MSAVLNECNTIKITTRDFGELDVCVDEIITFPNGIFAFENKTQYVLLHPLGDNEYPMWLQSTESDKPCFIVFDPLSVVPDYQVYLAESERSVLKIEDDTALRYLSIAVVYEDYKKTTINLKCPIVINTEQGLAAQVILPENYPFRHPLFGDQKGD